MFVKFCSFSGRPPSGRPAAGPRPASAANGTRLLAHRSRSLRSRSLAHRVKYRCAGTKIAKNAGVQQLELQKTREVGGRGGPAALPPARPGLRGAALDRRAPALAALQAAPRHRPLHVTSVHRFSRF